MSKQSIITENEFDRLPQQSQMKYKYCPECSLFYSGRNHLCGEGIQGIDKKLNESAIEQNPFYDCE